MTQNVKDLKQKSDMISSTDKIQHPCTIKTLNKLSFPGGSVVMNPPANEGDVGSIPGLGRSPGEGNGNPLQYSCLDIPMDRGVWWATQGHKESDTLSD